MWNYNINLNDNNSFLEEVLNINFLKKVYISDINIPLNRLEIMKVNNDQLFIYLKILKIIDSFRHPLCTDLEGWLHFSIFLTSKISKMLKKNYFTNKENIKNIIGKMIVDQNIILEYIRDLFKNKNIKLYQLNLRHSSSINFPIDKAIINRRVKIYNVFFCVYIFRY